MFSGERGFFPLHVEVDSLIFMFAVSFDEHGFKQVLVFEVEALYKHLIQDFMEEIFENNSWWTDLRKFWISSSE